MLALIAAVALLVPFTGLAQAGNGGSGDTAAGPHGFGRFLIGNETGPLGWVTFDVRPATPVSELGNPTVPGTFRFDALPGATGIPATTRSAVGWVNFYYEECCGNPDLDVAVMFGVECLYYTNQPVPANDCRDFVAGFYDAGPGTRHDFFRWGPTPETMTEYWIGQGTLTVNLGPPVE